MNVDAILAAMNHYHVCHLLVGGMNFMLRHRPLLTYDVDLWIEDNTENRRRCEQALAKLDAEWGSTEENWGPVRQIPAGWLDNQAIYCLNSPHGAIDIMRTVKGLNDWHACWRRAVDETTNAGTRYRGLADADMLQCQLALSETQRKAERVRILRELLQSADGES